MHVCNQPYPRTKIYINCWYYISFLIVACIAQSDAKQCTEAEWLTRDKQTAHGRAWPKAPRLLLLAWSLHISPWLLSCRACFQLSHGGPWDIYSWLWSGLDHGGDYLSKSGHGSLFFLNYLDNCLKSNNVEWSQSHNLMGLLPPSTTHSYLRVLVWRNE